MNASLDVLVVGGGGREHALAWHLAREPEVRHVYVAPGNAGTATETGVSNLDIAADDIDALIRFASDRKIGLTVVGPEGPLVQGISDQFRSAGLPCFGPDAAAAKLEGSKAFAKAFMARHGIPTAACQTFDQLEPALGWIRRQKTRLVVKADGLAAGKGVMVTRSAEEACDAARRMLAADAFGSAGRRIVVEEFLEGEEASFIAMVSGEDILPLASSQDHKARDDGDRGPNTGGMGAYSPAPAVTPEVHERIMNEIMRPTVAGLGADGSSYLGFLYAGVMLTPDGSVKVLEFNCRFGDPETQPVMMRLRSSLSSLCLNAISGRLGGCTADWDPRVALGVVMAAGGYPAACDTGFPIAGLPAETPSLKVFHAGTALRGGETVTSGGRVLCVVGMGDSVAEAADTAYGGVSRISWKDCFYRRDIGHRAIRRELALQS